MNDICANVAQAILGFILCPIYAFHSGQHISLPRPGAGGFGGFNAAQCSPQSRHICGSCGGPLSRRGDAAPFFGPLAGTFNMLVQTWTSVMLLNGMGCHARHGRHVIHSLLLPSGLSLSQSRRLGLASNVASACACRCPGWRRRPRLGACAGAPWSVLACALLAHATVRP